MSHHTHTLMLSQHFLAVLIATRCLLWGLVLGCSCGMWILLLPPQSKHTYNRTHLLITPTMAIRFVSTWVRYECSPGHAPITSLSWSPWGNFIVSSSPRDSSLLLWDIPLGVGTCVGRGTGGGVARVAWSPDGRHVFAGKVSAVFQVWETSRWTSEQWGNSKGRCKVGVAACEYMYRWVWLHVSTYVCRWVWLHVSTCAGWLLE